MFKGLKIGVSITGSFCSLSKLFSVLDELKKKHADIYLILSDHVQKTSTRFYDCHQLMQDLKKYTEHPFITSIKDAEMLGPKIPLDLMLIFPATSNTISKLAYGICDSPVLMATKATLRNQKPIVVGMFTNDALSNSGPSWTRLINTKHIYFVPFGQDDPIKKPTSLVADETQVISTIKDALNGKQIQPVMIVYEKN